MVSTQNVVEPVIDAVTGEVIITTGTLTEYVLSRPENVTSGCRKSTYVGNPYKVRSASSPYDLHVRAQNWLELSSGCPYSDYWYRELKRIRCCGFHQTVDSASAETPPGRRIYRWLNHNCQGTTFTYYTTGSEYPVNTNEYRYGCY